MAVVVEVVALLIVWVEHGAWGEVVELVGGGGGGGGGGCGWGVVVVVLVRCEGFGRGLRGGVGGLGVLVGQGGAVLVVTIMGYWCGDRGCGGCDCGCDCCCGCGCDGWILWRWWC